MLRNVKHVKFGPNLSPTILLSINFSLRFRTKPLFCPPNAILKFSDDTTLVGVNTEGERHRTRWRSATWLGVTQKTSSLYMTKKPL